MKRFFKWLFPQEEELKPAIGCIAREIIADMAAENLNRVDVLIDETNPPCLDTFRVKGKEYELQIRRYFRRPNEFKIYGIIVFEFNEGEQQALNKAYENLLYAMEEKRKSTLLAKDHTKLKKLFPSCYV